MNARATPTVTAKRRGLLGASIIAGVVLAVAIGLLFSAMFQPRLLQVERLPDGTVLTLQAVTSGQQHYFKPGLLRLEWLWNLVPELRDQWGIPVHEAQTEKEALIFWTLRRGVRPPLDGQLHCNAFDEHGCEVEAGSAGFQMSSSYIPGPTQPKVEAWPVATCPRRGKTVGVRIDHFDAASRRWIRAAEFTAPNPRPGPYPQWTPQPLPVTKRAGNLAFTLTDVTTGTMDDAPMRDETGQQRPCTRLTCRITEAGKLTDVWDPAGVEIDDATGNRWEPSGLSWYRYRPDGHLRVYLSGALWPDEAAWKLRVEFSRSAGATFAREELWMVRNLVVPRPGQVTHSNASTQQHGATLRLQGIAGVGASTGDGWVTGEVSSVNIQAPAVPEGVQLTLVRAVDDRGRLVTTLSSGAGAEVDGSLRYHWGLKCRHSARTVDLTFAVHKSRFVEFLIKPSRIEEGSDRRSR